MIRKLIVIALVISNITVKNAYSQNCPDNIGFENGNFQNWKMSTGYTEIVNGKNTVDLAEISYAVTDRHTILKDSKVLDPYGKFAVVPKDGGHVAVKLGNDGTGAQAEGISYLLNVPLNKPEFTLTYQYAVVLEDPNHAPEEQPRFVARVKDLSTGQYIPCASFEYIATSNLPGFKKSTVDSTVIYKDWSAVTINLSGYQGKQLLLEFITADCTLNGHFGYAYVDVNNTCGELITGNKYCKGLNEMNISGPSGYKEYNWYNQDRTVKYGTGQDLKIKPAPAEGALIYLDLVPFDGFGCPNTITAVASSLDYQVQTLQRDTVCSGSMVDLLSSKYILNKTDDFDYMVYDDKDLTELVNKPTITQSKTYYVKATSKSGCETISTIEIAIYELEKTRIINPSMVRYSESVDITKDEIYDTKLVGITRTYYTDKDAQSILDHPEHITTAGTYYAKLTSKSGCTKMVSIEAKFMAKPMLIVQNPASVCVPNEVNIADPNNFKASDEGFSFSFYADKDCKLQISNSEKIDKSGTYYLKATHTNGSIVFGEITATINSLPTISVKKPIEVCYPQTVNLTDKTIYNGSTENCVYAYFTDAALTNKLSRPSSVDKTGTFYVKITNSSGCESSSKVDVVINELPTIIVNKTESIFDDEYIDLTAPKIIAGSKNYVSEGYFLDSDLRTAIADPSKVNKGGVYYISLTNKTGCSVSAPIQINIIPTPKILVPTAFTPQGQNNNRLYPFLIGIQRLVSFKVFNKWGILVYETNTLQNSGWDGQFKNKLQPFETFSWFAEAVDLKGSICQSKGKTVMIL
ncbi:hypothetical protein EZJ43_11625 [Pedobacter changchengzhani]|uniref:Gliding motility-associated C-terminal domain-containing protein n=1 Tax=Pedobacter changchengzhani TaxID=2529274 RepID=A0A4R5MKE1_9SPHI|nr:gliding motility-associated C-terminal domain-containing protein [Pedobacter changchengzhani]TDG35665.1 hypothetical protein EZJ43_11625 [Pedobacter changchengzhani]